MRFYLLLFVGLLYQRLTPTTADDVDDPNSRNDENKAEHREDNEPNPDQLALESIGDRAEPLPQKLPFNGGPPRKQPPSLNLPPRDSPPNHYKPFGHQKNKQPNYESKNLYNGPPPPPPKQAMDKYSRGDAGGGTVTSTGNDIWPSPTPEMPKIVSLDVKCEKNSMKVYLSFDKPFYGIVFSKGHYSNVHCVHLPAGLGRTSAQFEIGIHACGTSGNTENGLYGYGAESGSGTYFENIIVIQYDPQVQEVWDQARKLRCTWHDQYEKSVTFKPFPVDMLDVVRTDFAGDNVGCWMQIQVGKGPWAAEVKGLVKIGQTMTMVLAIKDDDFKFDMLVRNCMAHDGKRAPIQLVDQRGCVTRPKLMSRFTKIKNFGSSASVLSFAHFQAFKFPDSMEVHFQCTIQICRYQCPEQCLTSGEHAAGGSGGDNLVGDLGHNGIEAGYGPPPPPPSLEAYLHNGRQSDHLHKRRDRRSVDDPEKEIGLNRVIRVVSTGDLTFSLDENSTNSNPTTIVFPAKDDVNNGLICMTTPSFAAALVVLLSILTVSCLMSAFLCTRLRPFSTDKLSGVLGYPSTTLSSSKKVVNKTKSSKSCFYS